MYNNLTTLKKSNNNRKTIRLLLSPSFDEYQIEIYKSIKKGAEENNINLFYFIGDSLKSKYGMMRNALYNLINIKMNNGILALSGCLCNYIGTEELINFFNKFQPLPIVSIGINLKGFPSLTVDNTSGMMDLMSYLIKDHKFKKIAFIKGPTDNPEVKLRFKIYKDALRTNNLTVDENF